MSLLCFGNIGALETMQKNIEDIAPNAETRQAANAPRRAKWCEQHYRDPWVKWRQIKQERNNQKKSNVAIEPESVAGERISPVVVKESLRQTIFADGEDPIYKIATKGSHSLILTVSGRVFSLGDGLNGKLGNGETSHESQPLHIFDGAIDVSVGLEHSAIVTKDGEVYTFGNGEHGQLGHSSLNSEYIPKKIEFFDTIGEKVISVACGDSHTLALTDQGQVYAFGQGTCGQLGICTHLPAVEPNLTQDGFYLNQFTPKLLDARDRFDRKTAKRAGIKAKFIRFAKVACGSNFSALVSDDGRLLVCGEGLTGVCGRGTTAATNRAPKVAEFDEGEPTFYRQINLAITLSVDLTKPSVDRTPEDVMVDVASNLDFKQLQRERTPQILDVACGFAHLMCLADDGNLYACGLNNRGQCGTGNKGKCLRLRRVCAPDELLQDGIHQIACGTTFSIILSTTGKVYITGNYPGSSATSRPDMLVPTLVPLSEQQQLTSIFAGHKQFGIVVDDIN